MLGSSYHTCLRKMERTVINITRIVARALSIHEFETSNEILFVHLYKLFSLGLDIERKY